MQTQLSCKYFWHISSKSILIILSYTISQLEDHFLRHSVVLVVSDYWWHECKPRLGHHIVWVGTGLV